MPLVVPEVNAAVLETDIKKGIIANPNCSTIQLVAALKPLHDVAHIKRVVVSDPMSRCPAQAGRRWTNCSARRVRFSSPIRWRRDSSPNRSPTTSFPTSTSSSDSGLTKEEWEDDGGDAKKILDPDFIQLTATCVRVPVFIGHSESVNIEFEHPITAAHARSILREAPGVLVVDKREDGGYITPVEAAGEDATYVSRIRKDPTVENGLSMWIVADNLRKGAALNAVQIAECLINRKLLKKAA